MIKSKTSVNSRSSRRDFDEVETKSNFQRFVVDSTSFIISAFFVTFVSTSFVTVVSISFITIVFASSITLFFISASLDESIVNSIFEEMNRDVLIRLLTILISFFVDFANVFVANSISIQITASAIKFFVTFVSEFIIEIDFENLNDVLAKEQKRQQNLKLKMMNHEHRRVIEDFFFFVSRSTRDLISSRIVFVFALCRISKNRRIVVKTKIEKAFIAQLVIKKNENELMNENDEKLSDCVKCCRMFVSCRRFADVTCARCARQKQTCISIRFRFVIQKFLSNYIKFQFDSEKLCSNWRTLKQRFATRLFLSKFLLVNAIYFARFLRRENESDSIERMSMMSTRNS
jgi:hypothetical protein